MLPRHRPAAAIWALPRSCLASSRSRAAGTTSRAPAAALLTALLAHGGSGGFMLFLGDAARTVLVRAGEMRSDRSIELGLGNRAIAIAVSHFQHVHAATTTAVTASFTVSFTVAAAHHATHLAVSFTHALHGSEFAFAPPAALVGVKLCNHAIVLLLQSFRHPGPAPPVG